MAIRVGMYGLGPRHVILFYDPSHDGGEFCMSEESDGVARITVSGEEWDHVLGVLIHEAAEMACAELSLRYAPDPSYVRGSDLFSFMMNHREFSEVCSRVGILLAECLTDLRKAFDARPKT